MSINAATFQNRENELDGNITVDYDYGLGIFYNSVLLILPCAQFVGALFEI